MVLLINPDIAILLDQPSENVTHFSESKLLTQTDSGTTIERQKLPSLSQRSWMIGSVPSFGFELLGIFTPVLLVSVCPVNGIVDFLTLGHKDGLISIRSTSSRKSSIFESHSQVDGYNRMKSQNLVQNITQVLTLLETLETDVFNCGPKVFNHGLSQLVENVRFLSQLKHEPG